ncbi:MAG TPA: DUF2304 domain-containing protein [Chitinophagaceae bacterium]|jgi:hypothetical protein|nr:DUF2304 domain-containing protein [Chitinophagaceae bacterium]
MSGIQILLITGVIIIFIYYVFRLRSAVFDLLILFIFSGVAVFFILSPDLTTVIAKKLGVGRGTDMLFYICILLFLFIILKLFARINRLEKKLTDMVRQQAKNEARFMTDIETIKDN